MAVLESENAVVREMRAQLEDATKERDFLKQQVAGVRNEAERWKRRFREEGERNRKLQVDLTRSATEVREARAALELNGKRAE